MFSLLSEPARLLVLQALGKGPLTVGELVETTGLKQANISKHLGMLLDAGLVARTKEGNFARYSIAEPMIFDLCRLVCEKLHRDATETVGAFSRAGRK
jgi:DNA-binding transcriptional ArsR family regulator